MDTHPFPDATAVTAVAPGRFEAVASPLWTIGGKPNGGYLLALLGRAVVATSEHRDVLAASAHYLRAPDPGPVSIWVEALRTGRTASQLRARLSQDDRICVEALFTNGRLDPAAEPYWDAGLPAAGSGSWSDGLRVPSVNQAGVALPIADQAETRIDPQSAGYSRGEPTGRGEVHGWLSLGEGLDFDSLALLYAVDCLPPATFDIELTGWVPTIELTAYIRAVPAPGPVRLLQRAQLIDDQRVDEECWVWDSRGRVVAQCTQLAGIRLG